MPLARLWERGDTRIVIRCPGCQRLHSITVKQEASGPVWSWNGSFDKPTLDPSVNISWTLPKHTKRCHFFVRDGMIQYCPDSTHHLAGQTVPLEEVDDAPPG